MRGGSDYHDMWNAGALNLIDDANDFAYELSKGTDINVNTKDLNEILHFLYNNSLPLFGHVHKRTHEQSQHHTSYEKLCKRISKYRCEHPDYFTKVDTFCNNDTCDAKSGGGATKFIKTDKKVVTPKGERCVYKNVRGTIYVKYLGNMIPLSKVPKKK